MLRQSFVVAALALSAGCGVAARPVATKPTTGRSRDIVTSAELRTTNGRDALEAIRQLRPEFFLGTGGAPTDGPLQVYVDGRHMGESIALMTVPLSAIKEVQYFRPSAASDRFGPYQRRAAAIEVRTRG